MNNACKPRSLRVALLRRASLLAASVLMVICMSVYIAKAPEKLTFVLSVAIAFVLGRRLFTAAVMPMVALIIYDIVITCVFPASKQDLDTIVDFPLFSLVCVLLCTLCMQGRSLRAQYFAIFGILAVSAVGAAGDLLGHDMTALLPFPMPSDNYFDAVTMTADAVRIRGFFPESGVLGAVALTMSSATVLGGIALMATGRRRRLALAAFLTAGIMGLAFICLTVTKSGAMIVGMSFLGVLAALAFSRRSSYRALAFGATAAAFCCAAFFLFAAPPSISSYFRGEAGAIVNMAEGNAVGLADHEGMVTRVECWKLALYCPLYYPFGVGRYGHGSVLAQDTPVRPTPEMRLFFDRDNFGLKNALANILAETGVVGIGLLAYWIWVNLLAPARRLLRENSFAAVPLAALYIASAFCSIGFLFSCEIYPSLALMLLLKYHADAVAHEREKALEVENAALEEAGETDDFLADATLA